MKKLTAGILTVMLGLVAADANASVTSKKYVDDALKATNSALTSTINTTKTELTEKITEVEGDVDTIEGNITTINQKLDGEGDGSVAKKIAAAVKTETDRATAAEKTLTDNLAAEVTRAEAAEGKLTTDLAAEVTRAEAAEGKLTTDLAAEVTRADTAEKKIAKDLADYQTSNDAALALKADTSDTYTKTEVDAKETALEGQIGTLTALTTTKKGSAVEAINELDTGVKANKTAIDSIKDGTALADGAVTEAKIADDAVTTDKIKDGAVTTDKLATVTTTGTGTKITYNAQGQVTKSEALTAADIPTLTADKISNLNKLASATLPESCNEKGADCVLKFNGTTYAWEDIAATYTPGAAE